MAGIVFITGGARSGKSALALRLASEHKGKRAFVATMEPLDGELRARVEKHRMERGGGWDTFEEPRGVAETLGRIDGDYGAVVLDCLTLWLSNIMVEGMDARRETEALVAALKAMKTPVYVVSNEVGMGVVPDTPMGREFRDQAGALNQRVAAAAKEVYLAVSGIPVRIKGFLK